jgi:hypothetical protein
VPYRLQLCYCPLNAFILDFSGEDIIIIIIILLSFPMQHMLVCVGDETRGPEESSHYYASILYTSCKERINMSQKFFPALIISVLLTETKFCINRHAN